MGFSPLRGALALIALLHAGFAVRTVVLLHDEVGLILDLLTRRALPHALTAAFPPPAAATRSHRHIPTPSSCRMHSPPPPLPPAAATRSHRRLPSPQQLPHALTSTYPPPSSCRTHSPPPLLPSQCPAALMQLLRLTTAGSPSVVASAAALSLAPPAHPACARLSAALAAHAGCHLLRAARGGDGLYSRLHPPRAAHALALAALAPALRRATPPPHPPPPLPPRRAAAAALGTVGLGAALALRPALAAGAVLSCAGETLTLPAHALAAVGASLLPLGVGTLVLSEATAAPAQGAARALPARVRRPLAAALAISGLAQAGVALFGAHAGAVCSWARVVLASACLSCSSSCMQSLLREGGQ
ncbi:hypothetical protein AB1Y20_011688 [Prymnesium parvum]|uniref:Uncharacterized protein n=1 Tax=Prymnesium parvum TaxID=97485 RepID=A0AB34IH87_PRYPA